VHSLIFDIIRRYTFSGQQQRFTRFVAIASMLGMVIGVASLITVLSVMNGFSRELHTRILSVVAHAYVTPESGQLADWPAVASTLKHDQRVTAAVPYIDDTVLLRLGSRTRGVQLSGVDPAAQLTVNAIDQHMVTGDWQDLASPGFKVVLGRSLARSLGVTVGDRVEVVMPIMSVTPMGIFPRRRSLEVIGEFQVGAEPDLKQAFVSLDTARRLTGRQQVDGLQLRLVDMMQADSVAADLQGRLGGGFNVQSWSDTQGSLFAAVRMEKVTVAVLLLSVVAVAAFNIVSTLTMSVTDKRSDIAVLRVLGLSRGAVLSLFMGYGLTLGLVGIVAGGVIGVALALNINQLVGALERLMNFQLFDPAVYYIGALPSELHWGDVSATLLAALLLTVLATLYPAIRAARIPAAEVLRGE
jgi:lipoprotein-releasing system permease protein